MNATGAWIMSVDRTSNSTATGDRAWTMGEDDPLHTFEERTEIGAWDEAEALVSTHLTEIALRHADYAACVRAIPRHLFSRYPLLALARLFIDLPDLSVPMQNVHRLLSEMRSVSTLGASLENTSPPSRGGRLRSADVLLHMIMHRLSGRVTMAHEMGLELEGCSLGPTDEIPPPDLCLYLWQIAYTGVLKGDIDMALRVFGRLREHAVLSQCPDGGSGDFCATHARDWEMSALEGLALTHELQGDRAAALNLLEEAETKRADAGTEPPVLTWLAGATARSLIAEERVDTETQQAAYEQIRPWLPRTELRPLLMVSEISRIHREKGIEWSAPQFQIRRISTVEQWREGSLCAGVALTYQAMLLTWAGQFAAAGRLVDTFPDDSAAVVERARLALLQGDNVQALLLVHDASFNSAMRRHHADRLIITACAAWGCGQRQEAFVALREAATLIRRFKLESVLARVPWAPLRELAVAAQDDGVCDLVAAVDAVPEAVRIAKYAPLSRAELLALKAMTDFPRVADAARELFVTPATMKRTRVDLYRKLGASSLHEALLKAARRGLI